MTAIDLSVAARVAVTSRFFSAHPGDGEAPFGLGRAVLDFVQWELRSGRIADTGGSGWWRTVNGCMIIDLRAAMVALALGDTDHPSDAVAAWTDYVAAPRSDAQQMLWRAHQASIARGLAVAAPLLANEDPAEREFACVVVEIVSDAAAANLATGDASLASLTERVYPAHYPATQGDMARLRRGIVQSRVPTQSGSR